MLDNIYVKKISSIPPPLPFNRNVERNSLEIKIFGSEWICKWQLITSKSSIFVMKTKFFNYMYKRFNMDSLSIAKSYRGNRWSLVNRRSSNVIYDVVRLVNRHTCSALIYASRASNYEKPRRKTDRIAHDNPLSKSKWYANSVTWKIIDTNCDDLVVKSRATN